MLFIICISLTGCAAIKKSPALPDSVTISTANHSETGKIVGVGFSATYQLK